MHANLYLLDFGNTQLKACALHADDTFVHIHLVKPISFYTYLDEWAKDNRITHDCSIVVASVRSEAENQAIRDSLIKYTDDVQFVATEQQRFKLKNSYANVTKMGVDRWLAMLGAQLLCDGPYVVIDAGTAITVDAVADGQHLGGWIVPGFRLAQRAVTGSTRRVFQTDIDHIDLTFGQDTEDCLHYGCIAQAKGILEMAEHIMRRDYDEYFVIISGGDQELFKQSANSEYSKFVSNIVFWGLLRYAMADYGSEKQQLAAQSLDI